jgi:hypothetical protein
MHKGLTYLLMDMEQERVQVRPLGQKTLLQGHLDLRAATEEAPDRGGMGTRSGHA